MNKQLIRKLRAARTNSTILDLLMIEAVDEIERLQKIVESKSSY